MGKIEELEKELYEKEEKEELTKRMKKRILFPHTLEKPPTHWEEEKVRVKEPLPEMRSRRAIKFYLWSIAVLVSMGVAAFIYFYLGTRGAEVELHIPFQGTIESGEVITIPFSFKNISQVPLSEVELSIFLPEGAILIEGNVESKPPVRLVRHVADVAPGEEKREEIRVRLFGQEGQEKTVEATLLYRPENLRAKFSQRASHNFLIERVPLAVFVEVPDTLASGQEAEMVIRYTSHARLAFEDMSVRVSYPPGFKYISATPLPNIGETIWHVGVIKPGLDGEIVIRGIMSGEEGALETFVAEVGLFNLLTKDWQSYSEARKETKIAIKPLSVSTLLAGTRDARVNAGETLTFKVQYRNNTAHLLKNITITARPEEVFVGAEPEVIRQGAALLELATISATQNGVFNASTRSIVWAPGGTSALRDLDPGESGTFEFRVSTKPKPVVRTSAEQNLVVRVSAQIKVADVPSELKGTDLTHEDKVDFKVNSKLLFVAKTVSRNSPIPNTGPIPPKVGEKTTYTVVWEVRNFTSELQQVEVAAAIPPNMVWESIVAPADARITYDANSGMVRWRPGSVPAGTGVITPALSVAFQLSLTPAEADINASPLLAQEITFTGKDVFTGFEIKEEAPALTTRLSDPDSSPSEWSVVK